MAGRRIGRALIGASLAVVLLVVAAVLYRQGVSSDERGTTAVAAGTPDPTPTPTPSSDVPWCAIAGGTPRPGQADPASTVAGAQKQLRVMDQLRAEEQPAASMTRVQLYRDSGGSVVAVHHVPTVGTALPPSSTVVKLVDGSFVLAMSPDPVKTESVARTVAENINRGKPNEPAVVLDASNNALLYSAYHSAAGAELTLEVRLAPDAWFDFLMATGAEPRRLDARGIASVYVVEFGEDTAVVWRDPGSGFVVSLEGPLPARDMTELVKKVQCA